MNSEQKISYDARVECGGIDEQTKVSFDTEMVAAEFLFSEECILYSEIKTIDLDNYMVTIQGERQTMKCSRMGQQCEWFCRELVDAYNKKILNAFSVNGSALFETKGVYEYEGRKGKAGIQIFEDSICILPANQEGRRIPFAFINGLQKEDYAVNICLSTGERYRFSMMGRDMDPFIKKVTDSIREERGKEREIAKPVNEELRSRALGSKMKETYQVMERILDGANMYVGAKRLSDEEFEKILVSMENASELTEEEREALRWLVWAVAPTKDGSKVVAEFSIPNEAASTYVFAVDRDWASYIKILNRALEATHLGREEFSATEEQLRKNANSKMLVERTPAIQILRTNFIGKIVHRSMESWEKSLKAAL